MLIRSTSFLSNFCKLAPLGFLQYITTSVNASFNSKINFEHTHRHKQDELILQTYFAQYMRENHVIQIKVLAIFTNPEKEIGGSTTWVLSLISQGFFIFLQPASPCQSFHGLHLWVTSLHVWFWRNYFRRLLYTETKSFKQYTSFSSPQKN